MIRYGGSPRKPRDRAFGGTCAPKSEHWRAKMLLAAVVTLCLAMLLAGCGGSFRGNASAADPRRRVLRRAEYRHRADQLLRGRWRSGSIPPSPSGSSARGS